MLRLWLTEFREAFWRWLAWRLPGRLVYWAMIRAGVENIPGDVEVPGVHFVSVLKAMDGKPIRSRKRRGPAPDPRQLEHPLSEVTT